MELWNLLDTSVDEQKQFEHVTCLISSSIDEVVRQGCLALDVIEQVICFFLSFFFSKYFYLFLVIDYD